MIKVLVLICGCVEGMTEWNTETIRQQQQFSNMPPASTDEYKFLFQWYDHWLKNTGFFAFVELLEVWFAVEGSSEVWGAVLLVWSWSEPWPGRDCLCRLPPTSSINWWPAGLAFSSLPAPGLRWDPWESRLLTTDIPLHPEHPQTGALCSSRSVSSVSRETASSGGEEAKWC